MSADAEADPMKIAVTLSAACLLQGILTGRGQGQNITPTNVQRDEMGALMQRCIGAPIIADMLNARTWWKRTQSK